MYIAHLLTGCASLIVASTGIAAATAEVPKYSIALDGASEQARVTLCLGLGHARVALQPDSPRALRDLADVRRSGGGTLDATDLPWRATDWRPGECLAYTADVGAIADEHSDFGTRFGKTLVTDPQHWLLHADVQGPGGADVAVHLPEGWSISAPWRETGRDGNTVRFHVPDSPQDWSASLALGRLEEHRVELPGGVLRVALLFAAEPPQREKLLAWLQKVGETLLTAYGSMPLPDVQVTVVSIDDTSLVFRFAAFLQPGAVLGGESARGQGNGLQLVVDPSRPAQEFADDWTAIHELSHLLHPYLGDRGSWLAEGLATYYQNVLRARGGMLTEKQAWERLANGFRRGAAASSGKPLEQAADDMGKAHEFLRVYWAGAAYWLTVDVDLRRASGGRVGVDTALALFRDCCLPSYREWKPEQFVAKLDTLAKTRVFSRRYHEFAAMTAFPDWQRLFDRLGVHDGDDGLSLDGSAVDAKLRDDIVATRAR